MRILLASTLAVLLLGVQAAPSLALEKGAQQQTKKQTTKRRSGRGRRMREDNAPKVAAEAPEFTLKSLDGKEEVSLSDFRGEKPVVLIFGSYT